MPKTKSGFEVPESVKVDEQGEIIKTCRHINKHFYNTSGKLEDLLCTLPKGHAGDHFAMTTKNVADPITDAKGGVVKQQYREEPTEAYWGDAAGVPARDIQAGKVVQLTDFQKDLVMAILKKDPEHITVEQAIEQAKHSPVWLAGNV